MGTVEVGDNGNAIEKLMVVEVECWWNAEYRFMVMVKWRLD